MAVQLSEIELGVAFTAREMTRGKFLNIL
ncbi:hypothetical protein Nmel_009046, partial [Mimus melanotis]